ncbi:hypothetical protein RRG08_018524 [Elysia crispata]|uniref:Uncharacterized protein n=1 Tax=Elysia crispata TaxID=231223 RepID=A0AAE1CWW0_9GAST|nr:hypothetical protein RRG08_018524 [Elysia crispata]
MLAKQRQEQFELESWTHVSRDQQHVQFSYPTSLFCSQPMKDLEGILGLEEISFSKPKFINYMQRLCPTAVKFSPTEVLDKELF